MTVEHYGTGRYGDEMVGIAEIDPETAFEVIDMMHSLVLDRIDAGDDADGKLDTLQKQLSAFMDGLVTAFPDVQSWG